MKKSDTEIISAYLDNELNEIERKQVEDRLLIDTAFQAMFESYSVQDQLVRGAFSEIDDAPVPNNILNMLNETDDEVVPERQNVVELQSWRRAKWLSIAASFLLVALALPVLLTMNKQAITLADVLDSKVSGQTVKLDESRSVELVMSFSDTHGRFCREYKLMQPTNSQQNISCKEQGEWQTLVSSSINSTNSNNYQPASGGDSANIEEWLDSNMSGIPMSKAAEQDKLRTLDK